MVKGNASALSSASEIFTGVSYLWLLLVGFVSRTEVRNDLCHHLDDVTPPLILF